MNNKKTDFGKIINSDSARIVEVRNFSDVTHAISNFGSCVPAGTCHSMMGQSILGGKAMIRRVGAPSIRLDGDIVTADSHATLLDIDETLMGMGYQLPVSPDHRSLSLGGVISVGGYDPLSLRRGALVDSVESVTVIKGSGEKITTGNKSELCRLGKEGFIWSASIRAVKYPDILYVDARPTGYNKFCNDIPGIIASEHVSGVIYSQNAMGSSVETVYNKAPLRKNTSNGRGAAKRPGTYRESRKTITDKWVFSDQNNGSYRPWTDHFIPIKKAADFFSFVESEVNSWRLKSHQWAVFSIICKKGTSPHFPHTLTGSHSLLVGVYANVPRGEKDILRQVIDGQLRVSKFAQSLGGKPCLHGWRSNEFIEGRLSKIIENA